MPSSETPSPSSLEAAYSGIVTPAHYRLPAYDYTVGPQVAQLCAAVGYGPDPEQRLALDIALARSALTGKSVAYELALVVCRQNLKTGFFKMLELGWLFVTQERLAVHSAHEFSTSSETWRDLKDIIESSSMLSKRIPSNGIRSGNGNMSIEAVDPKTGRRSRLVFKTRTKTGGRGLSGNKVVLDEAFALQPAHMGALLPLVSAKPDGQIFYGTSAARPESSVEHGLVARGRGVKHDPRLAYIEWCAPPPEVACDRGVTCDHRPDTPGCGCDKREFIILGNPAAGRRISFETIASERLAMGAIPEEFGRERMGWHDQPASGKPAIDADHWAAGKDTKSELAAGAVAVAFDVTPTGDAAAIVAVGALGDYTHWRSEVTGRDGVLDARPGTEWLVGRLVEIVTDNEVCAVVMDSAGPAGAFERELLNYRRDPNDAATTVFVKVAKPDDPVPEGKARLVVITSREYAQSCGALDQDIRNTRWRHFDQRPLNEAVDGARTAPLGDAWKWSRKDSSVNIAPLVATTLARHGFAVYGRVERPAPIMLVGR